MTFISYAQNFEDVMLWRALKHIKNGFYVDVGANDPVVDSVTKAFYDNGWSGVNIEPLSEHIRELNLQRPNDINLQKIISNTNDVVEIWECETRGWATARVDVIQKHIEDGYLGKFTTVDRYTLEDVFQYHSKSEVHFLKVDVEGFETKVLLSNNWKKYRPWIIVIEATLPASQVENYEEWESILLSNQYTFAYADGLNRFYVADEHSELNKLLQFPPNTFDDFLRHSEYEKIQQISQQQDVHLDYESRVAEITQSLIDLQTNPQNHVFEKRKTEADLVNSLNQVIGLQEKLMKSEIVLANLEAKLLIMQQQKSDLHTKFSIVQGRFETLQSKCDDLNRNSHHWYLETQNANNQIDALIHSKSWRITRPLRGFVKFLGYVKNLPKKILRPLLLTSMTFVLKRPLVKDKLLPIIKKVPFLERRLRQFGINNSIVIPHEMDLLDDKPLKLTIEHLSPRGQELVKIIERKMHEMESK